MWVGQQVFAMRHVFNPQQTEAGIDGIIELAEPRTGAARASFLGVQVKTTIAFDAESEEQFSFYADARDIAYWTSAQIPILLVVSRAVTLESYAVVIQDYFRTGQHRNTKTIVFRKTTDKFQGDEAWSRRLLGVGIPRAKGFSFPALPREEALSSNLLEVILPKTLYCARTTVKTAGAIKAALRQMSFFGNEFILREESVYSVHSLHEATWNEVIDNTSIARSPFAELAFHKEKPKRFYANELLNLCLTARLRRDEVRWVRFEEMYVYAPNRVPTKRVRKDIRTEDSQTRRGLIFPTFYQGRLVRCRHLAIYAKFFDIDGSYYLQVDPTYYFSTDGARKHPKSEALIRAARILQKEQDYHNNLEVWLEILTAQPDFTRKEYPFLAFKGYLHKTVPVGIPDELWKPKSKGVEETDLDQALLGLLE